MLESKPWRIRWRCGLGKKGTEIGVAAWRARCWQAFFLFLSFCGYGGRQAEAGRWPRKRRPRSSTLPVGRTPALDRFRGHIEGDTGGHMTPPGLGHGAGTATRCVLGVPSVLRCAEQRRAAPHSPAQCPAASPAPGATAGDGARARARARSRAVRGATRTSEGSGCGRRGKRKERTWPGWGEAGVLRGGGGERGTPGAEHTDVWVPASKADQTCGGPESASGCRAGRHGRHAPRSTLGRSPPGRTRSRSLQPSTAPPAAQAPRDAGPAAAWSPDRPPARQFARAAQRSAAAHALRNALFRPGARTRYRRRSGAGAHGCGRDGGGR